VRSRPPPTGRPVTEAALQGRYRDALALHRAGQLDAAEAGYRGILAARPKSFHALHMLGVLRGQRDDWAEAERLIAAAVQVDPNVAAAHANLGNARRLLGQRAAALDSYERSLRLQPANVGALKGRGLLLWELDRTEEALASYDTLLAVEPDYADGWIMRGACLDKLGRLEESIAAYRRALDFEHASDPEKVRYVLASMGGGEAPARSPVHYVRSLFDKYARRFDDHLVRQLRYRGPALVLEVLRPFLGEGLRDAVDLGCGTGLGGELLRPHAARLVGIDLSPKMLEEAGRKQVYDSLVEADMVAWLAGQRLTYDLAVAIDAFIYLGDLAPALAACRDALRPGGLFAFTIERSDGDAPRLLGSLRYAHPPGYVRQLAEAGGWRIESETAHALRQEDRQDVAGQLFVLRRVD